LNDSALVNSAVDVDFEEATTKYKNIRLIFGFTI
jgi:hypothetical protein